MATCHRCFRALRRRWWHALPLLQPLPFCSGRDVRACERAYDARLSQGSIAKAVRRPQ